MSEQSRLQRIEAKLDEILDRQDKLDMKYTQAINREQEDSTRKFPGHEQVNYKFTGGFVSSASGIAGD